MTNLRLTNKVDLGILYEIESARYPSEILEKCGLTKEVFTSRLEHHASIGYELNGQPIGGMFFDGKEPHLAVLRQHHGRWIPLWKPSLDWLFSLQDPIFSRVEVHNEKCLHFMDRNKWKRVQTDEQFVIFEVTAKGHVLFSKSRGEREEPIQHPSNRT